ncbi:hypothetical protein ACQ1P5_11690, partial [Ornithobacterium rhinotracheale]
TYHDPCPNVYHTPSKSEWEQLLSKVGSGNSNMWNERKLNLPAAGFRNYANGSQFIHTGSGGYYWSSTESLYAWVLRFSSSGRRLGKTSTSLGYQVRCLKD